MGKDPDRAPTFVLGHGAVDNGRGVAAISSTVAGMAQLTIHPHQVRAWGHAAQRCGHGVTSAKHHVSVADDDVAYANASTLASVPATTKLCAHWETQLRHLSADVTGTGDKLVSTANLVSRYDLRAADPFARVPSRTHPGPNP